MCPLNTEQQAAYDAILAGRNVCLTGGAGVGKTYVVREAVDAMRRAGKRVLVTAPTGIAALNLGGTTIHRAFNVGFFDLKKVRFYPRRQVASNLSDFDAVVIDEVSMCRADLFDLVAEYVLESWKSLFSRSLQLIVSGDFLQLPPVVTKDDADVLILKYGKNAGESFAFQSKHWDDMDFERHELTKVVRQQEDGEFARELNKARVGDKSSLIWIYEHSSDDPFDNAITICGKNFDADSINSRKLRIIDAPQTVYEGHAEGDAKWSDTLMVQTLVVKPGARVMGLVNTPSFKNGSLGTVTACHAFSVDVQWDGGLRSVVPVSRQKVLDAFGDEVGSISQIPLRLAFAITIHKSQGQTFDHVNIMPNCFAAGQLYVALSRCTHAGGIYFLRQPNVASLKVNASALEFTKKGGVQVG